MKKMILVMLSFLLISSVSMAQGQGKGAQKQKESEERVQPRQPASPKADSIPAKPRGERAGNETVRPPRPGGDHANKPGHKKDSLAAKGNAHGKHKGTMTGREFGQQRAADAKASAEMRKQMAQEKKALAEQRIKAQEKQIQENEARIVQAKERVRKQRMSGEISVTEEKVRNKRINQAEDEVKKMRAAVESTKRDVRALEEELSR